MASRGSAFSRTMDYFRSADMREADAALVAAAEVVAERKEAMAMQPTATERPRRKRRTTEQIAEEVSQLRQTSVGV